MPRREAKTATFASRLQLPIIHVQRTESEGRTAPAERRAPGRNVDDGLEPSDRTVDDGLELQKGGSDEVSLSFKGEQFQGFSVFASPAPPVRRKSSKDLK